MFRNTSFSRGLACLVVALVSELAGCSTASDGAGGGGAGAAPECGGCAIPYCDQPVGACDCGCIDGDTLNARSQTYQCKDGCFSPQAGSAGGTSSGGAGGPNAGGSQASGGMTNAAGSGGAGIVPGPTCPQHPPAQAASCATLGETCAYEECASAGRTVARCQDGSWSLENAPCADSVVCSGRPGLMSCEKGQLCLMIASGALITQCVPNDCGDGPIDCNCLHSCSGNCVTIAGTDGITISCNTCTSGQCA